MRLVRYDAGEGARCGILRDEGVIDVQSVVPECASGDMAALLRGGLERLAAVSGTAIPLASVRLLPPIINPPKIICAWVNYPNPAVAKLPELPIFFSKYTSAIIGNGDAIELPRIGDDIVVEPELAAVIGKGGKHIAACDALAHVVGYTIVNDVTAFSHRLQVLLGSTGPYMMAKSFDTFAPMGPAIVTSDEVGDPHDLTVRQWQNGELLTQSHTSRAIFKLPELIAYVSGFFRLEPGDILLTGSPPPDSGKPHFLNAGDHIRIEIERIGVLENPVCAEGSAA
jgi:2-keto-4-pentenoate hydratase/2-oxohepta-3-ene-1,7-dioic acid hydratase in catechol pathway